jgi:hypothetical protein
MIEIITVIVYANKTSVSNCFYGSVTENEAWQIMAEALVVSFANNG